VLSSVAGLLEFLVFRCPPSFSNLTPMGNLVVESIDALAASGMTLSACSCSEKDAVLCSSCLETRKQLAGIIRVLSCLHKLLADSIVAAEFLAQPLAAELAWKTLVAQPVSLVRHASLAVFASLAGHHGAALGKVLLSCEKRLEKSAAVHVACSELFGLIGQTVRFSEQAEKQELVERLAHWIMAKAATKPALLVGIAEVSVSHM